MRTTARPNLAPTPARRRRGVGGFTLVELLIVMGLIVVLIALAVPAFSFISGGKSIDGAQNVIAAMLGRARSEAINQKTVAGVVFFYDPAAGRNAMVLVSAPNVGDYDFWAPTTPATTYLQGQVVYAAANVVAEGKVIVEKWRCVVATTTAHPGTNTDWERYGIGVEVVEGSDIEYLPVGVACNVVRDTRGAAAGTTDRYTAIGAILFDETGMLTTQGFTATRTSTLGTMSGMTADLVSGSTPILYGSLGLMLCEREPLSNQNGYTAGDFVTSAYFTGIPAPATYTAGGDEDNEEGWLDQNGLLLVVNRSNGTLTRGE